MVLVNGYELAPICQMPSADDVSEQDAPAIELKTLLAVNRDTIDQLFRSLSQIAPLAPEQSRCHKHALICRFPPTMLLNRTIQGQSHHRDETSCSSQQL
jgi:hypothetical protein